MQPQLWMAGKSKLKVRYEGYFLFRFLPFNVELSEFVKSVWLKQTNAEEISDFVEDGYDG